MQVDAGHVLVWEHDKPARPVTHDPLEDLLTRFAKESARAGNRHVLMHFAQAVIEAGRPSPGLQADFYDLAAGFLDLLNDHRGSMSAALAALRGEAVPERYQDHPLVRAIRETIEGRMGR